MARASGDECWNRYAISCGDRWWSSARWRRRSRALFVVVLASGSLALSGTSAEAQSCVAGVARDFNGDGVADIAIADPGATVGGVAGAGRVHVIYGGGDGSQTITQADSFVSGEPEPGDRFGFSLASVDWDGDGCTDLLVGSPFESMGDRAEAGHSQILYGSPSGFGPNGQLSFSQDTSGMPGAAEAGDRFAFSVAAGETTSGAPYLVIGVPGEDVDDADDVGQADAGAFMYVRGSIKLLIHQDTPGVAGVLEAGDLYGYSVAASARHVIVGGPGEAVDSNDYAGHASIFTHDVAAGTIAFWDQDQPGDSGVPEASDWCGRSVAITDYIPPGGGAADTKSLVVIGCPGEEVDAVSTAGRVVTLDADGSLTEIESIGEGVNVVDTGEVGDYFGWSVAVVNRTPTQPVTWDKLLVVAGIPGEGLGGLIGNGAVLAFSALGPPSDHDRWVGSDELAATAWQATTDARFGQHLAAFQTHLVIADPYGAAPAVYAIPWQSIIENSTAGVRVYAPGSDGLPATGVGTFGGAIA